MQKLQREPDLTISQLVEVLPDVLEYVGEFGPELICFVPTIYWLYFAGLLENRKVRLYDGMKSFYYFLRKW